MQILSLQKQLGGGVGGWSLVFWGFVGVGFFLCVCVCCFVFVVFFFNCTIASNLLGKT